MPVKGLFLLLILGISGCSASYQAPKAVEIHQMTDLDGNLDIPYGPLSPVMEDVYDRSISAEVYSAE
jgi:hypothetical protein